MNNSDLFDGKSFCTLPFIHLATHPIGTCTPCCITDMENNMSSAKKDGNNLFLSKDSLNDITNSNNFKEIRRKMLKNEFPVECKTCYFHEKNHIYSKRMESNLKFKDHIQEIIANTNDDGELKKLNYKYLELRLGNICNQKCVTCNPFSSSKWMQDVAVFKDTEFEKDYFSYKIEHEWYKNQNFYNELLKHSKDLREIWINGGEPTLIKEHLYFLEKLSDMNRSRNIDLMYSINMSNIPDEFIKIWKKFKTVRIHLSIDDLYARNDYVRYGSKWENVYDNFLKILDYKNIFKLEICQTISALNVFNIDNFRGFFDKHEIIIAHNYVHNPSFLHPSVIPIELKKEILINIKYLRKLERDRLEVELNKNNIETEKFYKFINLLDRTRKHKIDNYLPEWKKYF